LSWKDKETSDLVLLGDANGIFPERMGLILLVDNHEGMSQYRFRKYPLWQNSLADKEMVKHRVLITINLLLLLSEYYGQENAVFFEYLLWTFLWVFRPST